MQLSALPAPTINANRQVADHLRTAHADVSRAQDRFDAGKADSRRFSSSLTSALESARQAVEGASSLGSDNVLDGTFHRYAQHSVRELEQAVAMLDDSDALRGGEGSSILRGHVFDAEVATRLGTAAADRSLANPARRSDGTSTSGSGGSSGSEGSRGPTWVDGEWIDELGNPTRDGGTWAGPDGQRYDSSGNAADSSGSWAGPDGESFSGI